jgi:hypothetical protein
MNEYGRHDRDERASVIGDHPLDKAPKIVPIRTLREGLEVAEGVEAAPTPATIDPVKQALLLSRYRAVLDELEKKTRLASPNVLVAPDDKETALVQRDPARHGVKRRDLTAGGIEAKFGTGITRGDWWGWAKSLFDWIDRSDAHPLVRPSTVKAESIPDGARVAVLGATGGPISNVEKTGLGDRARGDPRHGPRFSGVDSRLVSRVCEECSSPLTVPCTDASPAMAVTR